MLKTKPAKALIIVVSVFVIIAAGLYIWFLCQGDGELVRCNIYHRNCMAGLPEDTIYDIVVYKNGMYHIDESTTFHSWVVPEGVAPEDSQKPDDILLKSADKRLNLLEYLTMYYLTLTREQDNFNQLDGMSTGGTFGDITINGANYLICLRDFDDYPMYGHEMPNPQLQKLFQALIQYSPIEINNRY